MAEPRAALFDVDGTLIDSNGLHVEAWHEAFAGSGHSIERGAIAGLIGMGGDMLVPELLPDADADTRQRIVDAHDDIFKRRFIDRAKPFPEARALVERAHAHGLTVILASSASEQEVEHYIELLDVRRFVATRTSSDEVERSKPAPDIFAAALSKAGVPADRAIAIGDAPFDAESARKSGIATIGLLSGGFTRERLEQAGAIAIYADASALLADFDASPLAG